MSAVLKNLNQNHLDRDAIHAILGAKDAAGRVKWAMEHLPGEQIISSSFGAQAAVMLHLTTRFYPKIPVVFIDTGYLFPETYQFVETLSNRLDLNLQIYRSVRSPAWQEAAEGQRWEKDVNSLVDYNRENKVEPMTRALNELGVQTWFAGLRSAQSSSRKDKRFIESHEGYWKIHPILDWTDRDVGLYLKKHRLPYHPLWEKGYISIGDTHSTKALHEVDTSEQLRFNGLKRECGLHEM